MKNTYLSQVRQGNSTTVSRSSRAFTLTELLVSIAVALLLILGVNQVFKASSFTASAGQQLGDAMRASRMAKTVFSNDFRDFAADGIFAFSSGQIFAFRNASDLQGDNDGDPSSVALAGGNNVNYSIWSVNNRSHRLDCMVFFARGSYTRQTGSYNAPIAASGAPAPLTSLITSSEAMIWYGHLALPNNDWISGNNNNMEFVNPGVATSDNNRFASDFFLGRVATLLVPGTTPDPNVDPWLIGTQPMDPLAYSSRTSDGSYFLYDAPVDIANTSIADFTSNSRNLVNGAFPADWYNWMLGFDYVGRKGSITRNGQYRHSANPFIRSSGTNGSNARITAIDTSMTTPCMVRGCSQFIVEYAGNYLRQDNDPLSPTFGDILGAGPDPDPRHKVDFIVEQSFNNGPRIAKVRWYGFPRDTNGDGIIDIRDVIPLRDLLPGQNPAPFERIGSNAKAGATSFPPPPGSDARTFDYNNYGFTLSGSAPPAYVCAWDPNQVDLLPRMVRITIAIDDPSGRLSDAQMFESVYDLQQ